MHSIQFALQFEHSFVFLHQHGQQHDLKRKEVGGIGRGRKVMPGRSQKIIEGALVLSAKGATKASERSLLLQEGLGYGRKSASHEADPCLEQPRLLDRLTGRRSKPPGLIAGDLKLL